MTPRRFLDNAYTLTDDSGADEVRRIYDAWADTYDEELVDEHQYVMPARAAEVLARLVADRDVEILDVGCGTGLGAEAARRQGFATFDGCDLSERMLAHAVRRGIYRRLFTADLTAPPIDAATGHYGAVIAVGVFSFGHLGPAAVDEVLRPLRAGGIAVLTVNDHYERDGVLARALRAMAADSQVEMLLSEHGGHIPGRDVKGWVFAVRKPF